MMESEWTITENHHKAIIDKNTFLTKSNNY